MDTYQEVNDKYLRMIRFRLRRTFKHEAQLVKFVLVFILQDQFNMDKSKLNWGLMSGIYPAVWPGRIYDPVEWRFIDNPPEGWRLTDDPDGPGDSWVTRQVGQKEQQDTMAWQADHGRPTHIMVGRLKMKGIRNIVLQRKQD